jgi:sugar/nucleoside kinase (ribokinase family)
MAAGALAVTKPGASPSLPARDEVLALVAGRASTVPA